MNPELITTPHGAVRHALQELGIVCDPGRFLAALPWAWAVVDTNAIAGLAGGLIDELAGGLDRDPWDELPARAFVQDSPGQLSWGEALGIDEGPAFYAPARDRELQELGR